MFDNEPNELVAKCDRLHNMKHSSLFRHIGKCGTDVADHFADVSKMVSLGSGSEREVDDIMLTRLPIILQHRRDPSETAEGFRSDLSLTPLGAKKKDGVFVVELYALFC